VVQKVIDVVGVSPKSFADAAANAVEVAGETVRGMRWARVSEFEMALDGEKVETYRATVRIYFDVERDAAPGRSQPPEAKAPAARATRRKRSAPKKTRVPGARRKGPSEPEEDKQATEGDDEA